MVGFIHKDLCSVMWVSDDRVEEYLAAGHQLAAAHQSKDKPAKTEPKTKPKRQKRARRENGVPT